ncbi:MAG: hypothetical protein ACI9FN_002530 [Saprospiraceae bacterium]|jgi:hypothetical protein
MFFLERLLLLLQSLLVASMPVTGFPFGKAGNSRID